MVSKHTFLTTISPAGVTEMTEEKRHQVPVSPKEFSDFLSAYYQDRHGLRLGQALCNAFLVDIDAELFYKTSEQRALERFIYLYVKDACVEHF